MPAARSRFGDSSSHRIFAQGWSILSIAATFYVISLLNAGFPATAPAQVPLPGTPLLGPSNMPLVYFERIPIGKVLANPGDYHLRQVRMTGTIHSVQTIVLTQGCGRPYELTTLALEDETGAIEVFDQGACGGNASRLRASTLAVGDPVDLFVKVVVNKEPESSRTSVELFVIWIELARK